MVLWDHNVPKVHDTMKMPETIVATTSPRIATIVVDVRKTLQCTDTNNKKELLGLMNAVSFFCKSELSWPLCGNQSFMLQ